MLWRFHDLFMTKLGLPDLTPESSLVYFFFFLASFKYQKNYSHSESWNENQHILLNMLASNSTIWISKKKVKGSKMNTSLSAQALLN